MMARAEFPAWGGRAYASREDTSDVADYTAPRRSTRSYRQYASAGTYAAPRTSYSSSSRETAETKPKAKPELRVRAAKAYDDLPNISNSKNHKYQEDVASIPKTNNKEKAKKEIMVASHAPQTRTAGKEAAHRTVKSEKAEGPVTASMLPGFGTAKKTKKETATVARKPNGNAKNKKKK